MTARKYPGNNEHRREDPHSGALMDATLSDAKAGRMTKPVEACNIDLSAYLVSPRFGVLQIKPNGEVKVRPVDDCSRSRLNPCARAPTQLGSESQL